jgi:putative ATPase
MLKHKTTAPLAEQLRPVQIDDVVGQDHLLGPGMPLRVMVDTGNLRSMILWGPPGCGKTTLARILAEQSGLEFVALSAIFSGVAELRKIFDTARTVRQDGKRTVVFVDEIHRFNKSQQDAFLPVVEDGTIVLIGATTENPSFELNSALLSRCPVFILHRLNEEALEKILQRAEEITDKKLPVTPEARKILYSLADGDGRYLLVMVEAIIGAKLKKDLTPEELEILVQQRAPLYDKNQEAHYNLISALHKSVRGSDVDASLYWLNRMLEGGEDPHFIARRVLRMANEDVGLADPQALNVALTAWQVYERLGSPEGELAIAQAVAYMATAPKSNAIYTAYKTSKRAAQETGSLMPPPHAVNAPTKLMKNAGYSKGYQYDHDNAEGYSGQNYFPVDMKREQYYEPVERGFEREIQKRLAYFASKRKV